MLPPRNAQQRGLGGELIGVYRIDWGQSSNYARPVRLPEYEKVYVAGRLLFEGGKFVATDRLGSVAYKFGTGLAVCDPAGGGFVWTSPQTVTTEWRFIVVPRFQTRQ